MGHLLQARHSSSNLFLTISTWLKKKKKTTVQVRDGVQLVECLISIHEALGLSPSTIKRGRGRRRKWVDKEREEGRWYRQNHEHPFKGVSGIHPDTLRGTQQGKQSPWSFVLLGGEWNQLPHLWPPQERVNDCLLSLLRGHVCRQEAPPRLSQAW